MFEALIAAKAFRAGLLFGIFTGQREDALEPLDYGSLEAVKVKKS